MKKNAVNRIPSKGRIKVDKTSSAQFPALCADREANLADVMTAEQLVAKLLPIDRPLACLAEILYLSGSRVSAALAVKPSDITPSGRVVIYQGKGSRPLTCTPTLTRDYLLMCRRLIIYPFDQMNRYYVYRQFVKHGIFLFINGHRNKAVTHSFRHQLAIDHQAVNAPLEVTAAALGHKSVESSKHYRHE